MGNVLLLTKLQSNQKNHGEHEMKMIRVSEHKCKLKNQFEIVKQVTCATVRLYIETYSPRELNHLSNAVKKKHKIFQANSASRRGLTNVYMSYTIKRRSKHLLRAHIYAKKI